MQVTVTIRTTQQQFPGGTVGGNYRIDLAIAADPATITDTYTGVAPSHTFEMTDGQTYMIRGVRQDQAGNNLGPIETLQYLVGSDLVAIDVANSITAMAVPPGP